MALQLYEDDLGPGIMGDNPESALIANVPASGIGMAPPEQVAAPAREATNDMASLSQIQKVGNVLSEFGAGVTGQPSPMRARMETQRKEKLMKMEELKGSVSALEHGVNMVQGMEGPERQKFIDTYASRLDGIDAGLGETYKRLADRPDLLTKYKEYLPELPEHLQIMAKNSPKEFLKFVGTAEGVKAMGDGLDRRELRGAVQKVRTTMMGYQQLVPPEIAKGIGQDNVITASEVMSMQKYLPEAVRLSDSQMNAIQRNDKTFWQGLGVLHGEKEQEVLAARAKRPEGDKTPATKDIDGKVYQFDPDNKIKDGTRLTTDPRYVQLGAAKGPQDDAAKNKEVFDREFRLSDDYRQDTKKFAERRPLFDSATDYMANRAKEKTSAGDAALMFAYAKMRDPNDRLAVSETRDLVKLGNIFERVGASVTGVLDKGETLPDRVATEMYKEIRRSFAEQNKQQLKVEADYTKKTKDYGGSPERVVRSHAIPEDQLNPRRRDSDKPSGGAGEERKKIGNVSYVKKNGQWFEER